jgi:cell division protein FtsB
MLIANYYSIRKIALLASILAAIQSLTAQSASESDRLEKLERAVEQLQKRNAELEAEVRSLKEQTAAVPKSKTKTKITDDGKTYVEKAVPESEKPLCLFYSGDLN